MKTNVYSLFDVKAGAYGTPFFSSNDGTAVRAVTNLVNRDGTVPSDSPGDFTLYRVGDFDDNVGLLSACTPVPVVNCASLKRPVFNAVNAVPMES